MTTLSIYNIETSLVVCAITGDTSTGEDRQDINTTNDFELAAQEQGYDVDMYGWAYSDAHLHTNDNTKYINLDKKGE